jgi:hypothetical protein
MIPAILLALYTPVFPTVTSCNLTKLGENAVDPRAPRRVSTLECAARARVTTSIALRILTAATSESTRRLLAHTNMAVMSFVAMCPIGLWPSLPAKRTPSYHLDSY